MPTSSPTPTPTSAAPGEWTVSPRSSYRHPSLADLLLAGLLLLPALLFARAHISAWMYVDNDAQAITDVLTALTVAALVFRRTRPVSVTVVVYLLALCQLFVTGLGPNLANALVLIVVYSTTAYGPPWGGALALTGALSGAGFLGLWFLLTGTDVGGASYAVLIISVAVVTALFSWAIGLVRRNRIAGVESLTDRAARLERERDQQAQLATAAERARIAREMHDVVAHSLSVVIAQADGGRYAATADPEAAVRALTTVSEIGRAALSDMRRILGVLRDPDGERYHARVGAPGARESGTTTPQPMDGDLDDLVDQVRQSGVNVSIVRMGQPRQLPPGAGLTVYRICQEALTNVLKHAGPSPTVTLLVRWTPQRLSIRIEDDGRGAAAVAEGAGSGYGILGMRERAAIFDGTVHAGPRHGGGFQVHADIPVPSGAPVVPTPPRRPPPTRDLHVLAPPDPGARVTLDQRPTTTEQREAP